MGLAIQEKSRYKTHTFIKLIVFVTCILLGASVARALDIQTGWSWTNTYPTIAESTPVDDIAGEYCDGSYESVDIVGVGSKWVCTKSNDRIQLANYTVGPSNVMAVSVGLGSTFLPLMGTGCEEQRSCLYVPTTDELITKQHILNTIVSSLVIYKHVADRLTKQYDDRGNFVGYYFDSHTPDFIYKSSDGYPWPVEGLAASKNGKWLAVEFRLNGLGVINLDTYDVQRFSMFSMGYGGGRDPTTELAITDDGKHIALMGNNAGGIMIFDRTPDCGDEATDRVMQFSIPIEKPCKKVTIDTDSLVEKFGYASNPHFELDGAQLNFFVRAAQQSYSITLSVGTYTPSRLDYLALGDSFTSGEGETSDKFYQEGSNTTFEKCHLSTRAYPYLVAQYLGLHIAAKSVACSGATMDDIVGNDTSYWGQGNRLNSPYLGLNKTTKTVYQQSAIDNFNPGRSHQIEFVKKYQPKVITIGIGGNDVGFMDKLRACVAPGTCEWASSTKNLEQAALEVHDTFGKFVNTYKAIHDASPASKIYVIGYPKVIDPSGDCSLINGLLLDSAEKEFMNQAIIYLNQVIAAAAKAAGVAYISTENSFGNQLLCGSSQPNDMNGIRLGDDIAPFKKFDWMKIISNESFHPRPDGHIALANSIKASVSNLLTYRYCQETYSNGAIVCPDTHSIAPWPSSYWLHDNKTHNYPSQKVGEFVADIPTTLTPNDQQVHFSAQTFAPNSQLVVEIHSDPATLGSFTVNGEGGADFQINLPSDLPAGMHTVHVYGDNQANQAVDMYQVIQYVPQQATQTNNTMDHNGNQDAVQQSVQPNETNREDKPSISSSQHKSTNGRGSSKPAVLGQSIDRSNNTIDQTNKPSQIAVIWYVIGIGLLSALIVLIWRRYRATR